MTGAPSAEFGVLGLGTMGGNLALNLAGHGVRVALWNRTVVGVEERVAEQFARRHREAAFVPTETLGQLVAALERPRRLLAMVPAGAPLDHLIDSLRPFLEPGDVVVDGGNSHFRDTERRQAALRERGLEWIGLGVSGGAEGARRGPSLMPGGTPEAYALVAPYLERIAARSSAGPCVAHLGPGACGHYVKMVHNGIEYGLMQLLAEAFDVMQHALGMDAGEIAAVFDRWNAGALQSFLVEISAAILRVRDQEGGDEALVHRVLDRAGQKGTGRWTIVSALELGVAVPTLAAGVDARIVSDAKRQRELVHGVLGDRLAAYGGSREEALADLERGALLGTLAAYLQGFDLLRAASDESGWELDPAVIARIWRAGCIIRSRWVERLQGVFEERPARVHPWLHPDVADVVRGSEDGLRRLVALGARCGLPLPAHGATLALLDGIRRPRLPQNLTQAQRDAFGAHGFRRTDRDEAETHHVNWLGGES